MSHELLSGPLAVEPAYLRSILPALQKQGGAFLAAPSTDRIASFPKMSFVAAPEQAYGDGNSAQPGKVAIIPMEGLLTKRMSYYGYGYRMLNSWLEQAFKDPEVVGIVLRSDSPGGTVDGNEETTQLVANAPKPIVTWVDGMCCSAAYRIASQSSAIVVGSATAAIVGSIGTYQEHRDYSKALEQEGVQITFITADGNDFKVMGNGTEALTDEAIAYFKERLNPMNEAFKSDVQAGRGRKLTKEPGIFQSKVFNGQDSVKHGVADQLGPISEAVRLVTELANKKSSSTSKQSIEMKFPSLRAALGLNDAAPELQANEETLTQAEQAVGVANTAKATAETALATAQTSLQTLTTERDTLQSEKQTLTTERDTLQTAKTDLEGQVQTLNAWKKERETLGGQQSDELGKNDRPRASYNKAADEHRARTAGK